MRYVIIGNSAAGIFAAEAIRRVDTDGEVHIFSQEQYPAYARCLTSYYLTGQMSEDQTWLRSPDYYQQNNFQLHLGQRVEQVDTAHSQIRTASGQTYEYDRLLIATGATPTIPDLPGVDLPGVFGLRTLNDAKAISQFAQQGQRAVVVGGGLVALKAAYALLQRGMTVTCLITSQQILSQMLDQPAAQLVAQVLTVKGMEFKYGTAVQEILSDGGSTTEPRVSGVKLADGTALPADVVIIGKGVTSNLDLVKGSGIQLDRGIIVDERLQTNITGVYAAGDVAQAQDLLTGEPQIHAIWPNATEQGTVAGQNMAGVSATYAGSLSMNSADFFGLSIIAAGLNNETAAAGYEVYQFSPKPSTYRRLVFKGDNLVGYILVGDTAKAGLLTTWIREQQPLGQVKAQLCRGEITQRLLWGCA